MDLEKLFYLLIIVLIGYLPYKTLQRFLKGGLNDVPWWGTTLLSIWFIFLSTILLSDVDRSVILVTPFLLASFIVTTALWITTPAILRRIGSYPASVVQAKPQWFLVRAEPRTFFLKFFEVLFQQAKFLFLLTVVLTELSDTSKIFWFAFIVAIFHLNNFFFLYKREAFLFFFMSIPMGFLFSYLILHDFVIMTTLIHLWFYLLFVSWYWLRR